MIMDNNDLDKNLDKLVEAAIEEAFLEQRERYNYDEEITNAESGLYKPWIYGGQK